MEHCANEMSKAKKKSNNRRIAKKKIDSNNSNALNSKRNEENEAMKKAAQTDDRIPFLLFQLSTLCLFRLMFRYLKSPANVIFI